MVGMVSISRVFDRWAGCSTTKKPGRWRMKTSGAMMAMPRMSPRYQVREELPPGAGVDEEQGSGGAGALVRAVAHDGGYAGGSHEQGLAFGEVEGLPKSQVRRKQEVMTSTELARETPMARWRGSPQRTSARVSARKPMTK